MKLTFPMKVFTTLLLIVFLVICLISTFTSHLARSGEWAVVATIWFCFSFALAVIWGV